MIDMPVVALAELPESGIAVEELPDITVDSLTLAILRYWQVAPCLEPDYWQAVVIDLLPY